MCRPPDLTPSAAGFDGDGFDAYAVDGVEDWSTEGNLDAGGFDGSEIAAPSFLGKRELNEDTRLADAASRAGKFPRPAAPVSSAFDSAAASFMAKMEQSMLQDLQRQQQQRRIAAAAAAAAATAPVEGDDPLLLQKALLEQRTKLQQLQQLQQLQLLKQLQRTKAQAALEAQQQQQLLMAQQQLLQQSQTRLLDTLVPSPLTAAAAAPATAQLNQAWATLVNKPTPAATAAFVNPAAAAEAKIQAWMQGGVAGTAARPTLPAKTLPALHPKPVVPATASAAAVLAAGAELNTAAAAAAAAVLGLGHLGQPALRGAPFVVGEEKKAKRMQSNRASAKRSRQRRQARLEELDKTTGSLQMENATMCAKLEEAQKEIMVLEQKNRSLQGEVSQLRKMLGMEPLVPATNKVKVEGSPAASGAGLQQSCADSEGAASFPQMVQVKGEVESEEAHADADYDDDDAEEDAQEDVCDLDWLGSMPLSPSSDMKPDSPLCGLLSSDAGSPGSPGFDQLLVQGDVFSELLACLDG